MTRTSLFPSLLFCVLSPFQIHQSAYSPFLRYVWSHVLLHPSGLHFSLCRFPKPYLYTHDKEFVSRKLLCRFGEMMIRPYKHYYRACRGEQSFARIGKETFDTSFRSISFQSPVYPPSSTLTFHRPQYPDG